nr:vegetative cell wall protein gp1-like isoform X2 [Penaeus vannamei]
MPYMRYSRKVWDQVKAANNDLKLWEIGKIIGSMWRDLPEADKQDYVDEYESEKAEYNKALEVYHASPAYQQYLAAKAKGTIATEEKEILDRSSSTTTVGSKLDRRIDIQPAEDEDDYDDGLSVKHVSHSRYIRNHRLINEIFSDTMVPDVRSVVTSQRLTVLRRQVQSLTMHQKKLETELQQIEEKFEAKKRKFIEAGDSFQAELKKVKATAPKLDETSFASMVERQKEVLRREAEERQRTAQGLPSRPPSTSSSQVQPQSNAATREDSNDAAGPAPQNTATPVDAAASPAPMQENDMGGEDENKMEASTAVTSTAAATAPNVPAPTTTTAAAVPAVNGPTSAAPSTAPPLAPSAAAGGSSSQMTSTPPTSAQNTAAHSDASSVPRPAPSVVSSNPTPLPGTPQAPLSLVQFLLLLLPIQPPHQPLPQLQLLSQVRGHHHSRLQVLVLPLDTLQPLLQSRLLPKLPNPRPSTTTQSRLCSSTQSSPGSSSCSPSLRTCPCSYDQHGHSSPPTDAPEQCHSWEHDSSLWADASCKHANRTHGSPPPNPDAPHQCHPWQHGPISPQPVASCQLPPRCPAPTSPNTDASSRCPSPWQHGPLPSDPNAPCQYHAWEHGPTPWSWASTRTTHLCPSFLVFV